MKTKILLVALALGLMSACGNKTDIEKRKQDRTFRPDQASSTEKLYNALEANYNTLVSQAIKEGADINAVLPNGETPLTMAVSRGKAAIITTLLEARPDLNKRNEKDQSPLHIAIEKKDCYTLRVLVNAGADVNTKNSWGDTALARAIENGHTLGIVTLLKAGAELGDDPDDILNLAQRKDLPVVERLIEDIQNIDKNLEKSSLMKHVEEGNLNFVEYLLKQKNLKERANGIDLISFALKVEDQDSTTENKNEAMTDMVNALLDGGLSPNGETSDKLVPLVEAVRLGNKEALDLLLSKGADPNKLDMEGLSPLAHAIDQLEDGMAKKLLDYQASKIYSYRLGGSGYERNVCSLLPEKSSYLLVFSNMTKEQKERRDNLKALLSCQ